VGDRVFFFLSGETAGIYVLGRVVGPVYAAEESDEFGRWKVDVEYEALIEPPILRPELTDSLTEPILAAWPPFKGQLRTNFLMPTPVAERLVTLITGRTKPISKQPGQGFDETLYSVDKAIAAHRDHVEQQLLALLRSKFMTPDAFQELIRTLLERIGYEDTLVTGMTGDFGIDVVATLRLHGMTEVPTVVQAKRWTSRNVDGNVVRQLRGALDVKQHGVVITTSGFTKAAITEASAAGKQPIGLVDGPGLVALLIRHGLGVQSRPVSVLKLDPAVLLGDGAL
jgi:restriction endonuclease Mrr